MGRAAKIRNERKLLRQSPEFQEAVRKERNKVMKYAMEENINEFITSNVYTILAALVIGFGFGPVRLRRFMDNYSAMVQRMKDFYECSVDDLSGPCKAQVLRAGFDVDKYFAEKEAEQAQKATEAIKRVGDTNDKQRVAQIHPQGPKQDRCVDRNKTAIS